MAEQYKAPLERQELLKQDLTNRGVGVLTSLRQNWRHSVGEVLRGEEKNFLKIAGEPEISPFTQNEVLWYQFLANLPSEDALPARIPTVISTGTFDGLFWYTAEFVEGKPLGNAYSQETLHLDDDDMHMLALTAQKFIELPIPPEIADLSYSRVTSETIVHKVEGWQKEIHRDVSPLVTFMGERLADVSLAPAHGDYSPEQLLKTADKYFLIDLERARPATIKYYDVAYCYHRLYTKFKRPDLAEKFLTEFLSLQTLNASEKRCLELAIAQRLIGGYLDAQSDGVTSVALQEELEAKILNNLLLS